MFSRTRNFLFAAVLALGLSFAWTGSSQAWPWAPVITPSYYGFYYTPTTYSYYYAAPRVYYPPVYTPPVFLPPAYYQPLYNPAPPLGPSYQYWVQPYPNGAYRYAYRWWY